MIERRTLSEEEVRGELRELPGWSLLGGKLHREFTFGTFVQAFSFMTAVALLAEGLNHHPEWSNVYNRVTIDLSTHSAGGITGYDLELAKRIAPLASNP
jgi:4a-hydroxytetrahydrobiopterin dehydratase